MQPGELDHSDGRSDVSVDELFAFGVGRADEQTQQKVRNAMSDCRHPLAGLLKASEVLAEKDQRETTMDGGLNGQSE